MLALVEGAVRSSDEAFTSAELLENIWDWSDFIGDYLHTGCEVMTGTQIPHHFRFYVQNNEARLQYKIYQKDEWAPEGGYSALRRVPVARAKPKLAEVTPADTREVEALNEFIALKERQCSRGEYMMENRDAIAETHKLKSYLLDFPRQDRSIAASSPFWPYDVLELHRLDLGQSTRQTSTTTGTPRHEATTSNNAIDPLATLPEVELRGYFGPHGTAPVRTHGPSRVRPNKRPRVSLVIVQRLAVQRGGQHPPTGEEAFPAFNPHKDISIGQFVAVCSLEEDRRRGAPFWVGKVRALERSTTPDDEMTVLWYWPRMARGSTDAIGEWHQRYVNWSHGHGNPAKKTMTRF